MRMTMISLCIIIVVVGIIVFQSCGGPRQRGLETHMYYALEQYGKRVAKAKNMQFLIAGDVTDARSIKPYLHATYCLSLASHEKQTLDEGRIFAATLVEDFWKMLQHEPEVKKYAEVVHNEVPNAIAPPYAWLPCVGYKISYWDEEMNRMQKPYLAEMHFYRETFRYYFANPETQHVELVFEESYKDAIKFKNEHKKLHINH